MSVRIRVKMRKIRCLALLHLSFVFSVALWEMYLCKTPNPGISPENYYHAKADLICLPWPGDPRYGAVQLQKPGSELQFQRNPIKKLHLQESPVVSCKSKAKFYRYIQACWEIHVFEGSAGPKESYHYRTDRWGYSEHIDDRKYLQ